MPNASSCPADSSLRAFPRISPVLAYDDARAAVDFLERAFGFEVATLIEGPGNSVAHAELHYRGALVLLGNSAKSSSEQPAWQRDQTSPARLGGANTQLLCVRVDDAAAHERRAAAAGAEIVRALSVDGYGDPHWADKSYVARDCEGHVWWFMERVPAQPLP